jgi:hypothetical protein
LPNLRLVGLTDAAGVNVSPLVLLLLFAAAASTADALIRTGLVVLSNVLDWQQARNVDLLYCEK